MQSDGTIIHRKEEEDVQPGEIPLSAQELAYLARIPKDKRLDALVNLRFHVVLEQSKLKVSTIEKLRLRKFFTAGYMLSQRADVNIITTEGV